MTDLMKRFEDFCDKEGSKIITEIRADERAKTLKEVEEAMYHQCFEVDNPEDLQKWDGGNWFRYKLFENVLEKLKESKE